MNKRYLTPAEVCESFVGIGVRKAGLPFGKMLVLAILAGAFIGLAGVASTWASMEVANLSLRRLIAGCVFPAGLAMVVFTGTELFTGNCLMTIAWLEKKITLVSMVKNWCIVYLGNLIGGMAVAYMAVFGGTFAGKEAFLVNTAMGKIMSFEDALFRGILCNVLVCLGVLMAAAGTDAAGKVAALFFPVAAFVMAGYEHSVANMYYFSAGVFAGAELSVYDIVVRNLIPVTIGNIIGGGVILGGGYWYIYRKGMEK